MQMSWQKQADRLVCRWSEAGQGVKYNQHWTQAASTYVQAAKVPSPLRVLANLSPFGGRDWYVLRGA